MLQRQNTALQSSLQQARRALSDTEQQLKTAQATLEARDNTMSVYERQWARLEEQLVLLLAQLEGAPPSGAASGAPRLSSSFAGAICERLCTRVAPLAAGAVVDGAVDSRCDRMLEIGRALVDKVRAAEPAPGGADTDAAISDFAAARVELSAKVELLEERQARSEASAGELAARLAAANDQLDKLTKELNREKLKRATEAPAAPAGSGGIGGGGSSSKAEAAGAADASGAAGAAGSAAASAAALAEAKEAKDELEEARKQAQQWLTELQGAKQEVARARAAEQEMRHRLLPDEQLRQHPSYQLLEAQAKQLLERVQESDRIAERHRADAAQVNTLRHTEHTRFEDYRLAREQQASDETKAQAELLATAQAERRSLEMKLGEVSLTKSREVDRATDLDQRLRFATQEMSRLSKEVERLRQLASSKEAERDAARAAQLDESQRARAATLELEALRKASDAEAGEVVATIVDSAAEKERRDTLVRLGSAEQKAQMAQQEVQTLKNAQAALEAEVEEVTQTYEDVDRTNNELRKEVSSKDDAVTKAKADKMRADHMCATLKAEQAALQERLEKLASQSESLAAVRASFEAQLRKASEVSRKRDEEYAGYESTLSKKSAELKVAQAQAAHATSMLRAAQEAEARSKEREESANASAATEQVQAKRLAAERDALSKRVARLTANDPMGGANALASEVQEQLEYYRSKVKCTLCLRNDKDAIISKCMHAFCRECIQKRLDVRNRKCPACALQFDFQSVKDLYLTS